MNRQQPLGGAWTHIYGLVCVMLLILGGCSTIGQSAPTTSGIKQVFQVHVQTAAGIPIGGATLMYTPDVHDRGFIVAPDGQTDVLGNSQFTATIVGDTTELRITASGYQEAFYDVVIAPGSTAMVTVTLEPARIIP